MAIDAIAQQTITKYLDQIVKGKELIISKGPNRGFGCSWFQIKNYRFCDQHIINFFRLASSFNGQGWSWHQGLPACGNTHLSLIFKTQSPVGTLLYNGPLPTTVVPGVSDFMLLEIVDGKLKLHINFGSGVRTLELGQQVYNERRKINNLCLYSFNTS